MKLFVPFDLSKADDEQRIVEGYASTEALDCQGEIIKREAMERALPDWLKFGNIREMHQPSAVGVAVTAEHDDKGLKLCAKIVDPLAWEKVKQGVYKGFSIGGRVTNRDKANKAVITGLHLTEISLVDRPANPEALFDVWKADGVSGEDTAKGMYTVTQLAEILTQIKWLAEDSKWEEMMEGDTASTLPEGLQDWLRQGGTLLGQMVVEEVSEMAPASDDADVLVIELADKAADLAKGGKRNSQADQKKLNEAHDAIVSAGAECGAEKHDHAVDLTKAHDDLAAVNEQLAKAADDLTKAHTDLATAQTKLTETESKLSDLTKAHATTAIALADLTKAHDTIVSERSDLAKQVEVLTGQNIEKDASISALGAELAKLKAQPEPMKGKVLAVAKADDVTQPPAKLPSASSLPKDRPPTWFGTRPSGDSLSG